MSGSQNITYDFSFDEVGNRTFSSEWSGGKTFTYDLAGQITTMAWNGSSITHTYDENGNLVRVEGIAPSGAQDVTMAYDYENRLTRVEESGSVISYTYSGDGMKRSETGSGGTTTFVWDGLDVLEERS